jgi:hypothetical protein
MHNWHTCTRENINTQAHIESGKSNGKEQRLENITIIYSMEANV